MDCTDKGNAQLYRQQIQLLFLTWTEVIKMVLKMSDLFEQ